MPKNIECGISCPKCDSVYSKVIDTRPALGNSRTPRRIRRRQCSDCDWCFFTEETKIATYCEQRTPPKKVRLAREAIA